MAKQKMASTSLEALQSIDLPKLENIVYTIIRSSGRTGVTADELLLALPGLSYSSVTARPASLKRKGLIVESGVTRLGRTGRNQKVLVAAEFGGLNV
jgi:hypothetical protein